MMRWMLGVLLTMCLGLSAAPARAVEPFAQALDMSVIDPAADYPGLSPIAGFHRVLVPTSRYRVLISYDTPDRGPCVLTLNPKSLAVVAVHRAHELGLSPADHWRAAATMPDGGAVFCASPSSGNTEDRDSVAVTFVVFPANQSKPRVIRLFLPEAPTALAPLPGSDQLLTLTRPSNFAVQVDLAAGKVRSVNRDIFPFIPYAYPAGRCLTTLADGSVYGSFKGRLFHYLPPPPPEAFPPPGVAPNTSTGEATSETDHEGSGKTPLDGQTLDTEAEEDSGFFAYLGLLPCAYGHLSQVALSAAATNGQGLLVGGTAADGYLFTVDTKTQKVKPWGKPTDGGEIRALVHAGKTGFWGLAVTPGQTTRLFNFRPTARMLKDYGVPIGTLEEDGHRWTWRGHRIADLAVLPDGRLLLAEKVSQAKLLVFDPAHALKESSQP